MSLNFSFKDIANWDEIVSDPFDTDKISPVTNNLIWMTMAIDLGEISEKNYHEFWWRTRLLQRLDGPELTFSDGVEMRLTEQDIRDHIGLKTNVIDLPRKKWLVKFFTNPSGSQHPKLDQTKSARQLYGERAEAFKREKQADAQDE